MHISTASVYDLSFHKVGITEEAPLATEFLTGYSRSKLAAERLVASARGHSVVLRPHIVYGAGDAKILPRLLSMRRLGALVVPGNGQARISVTQVENLADAVLLAIDRRAGHEVFNIADSTTGTVDELLTSLQHAFGIAPRIWHACWSSLCWWPVHPQGRNRLWRELRASQRGCAKQRRHLNRISGKN